MNREDISPIVGIKAIKVWLLAGALLCMLSVIIGAFAAHALKTVLNEYQLAIFDTGAQYQMYHGLAILLASSVFATLHTSLTRIRLVNGAFVIGCTFFSGSLYCLAVFEIKIFAYFTPIGGLFLIIGWCLFIWTIFANPKQLKSSH